MSRLLGAMRYVVREGEVVSQGPAVDAHARRGFCLVTGKRRHSSKHDARAASRGTGHRLSAYRCEHCGDWHVAKAHTR